MENVKMKATEKNRLCKTFKLCCRFKKVSNALSKTERAKGYLFSLLKIVF